MNLDHLVGISLYNSSIIKREEAECCSSPLSKYSGFDKVKLGQNRRCTRVKYKYRIDPEMSQQSYPAYQEGI